MNFLEKFIFLFIEGLKSEPILDINEVKNLKLLDTVKLGSKLEVLLEKITEEITEFWIKG